MIIEDNGKERCTLLLTSVHRVSGSRSVMVGRDERGILRKAVVEGHLLAKVPISGETWKFEGRFVKHEIYGEQLRADKAYPLEPKNGRSIEHYLSSKAFPGIGSATASRLTARFGESLYKVLAERDTAALAAVVGVEKAFTIVDGFGLLLDDVEVLRWMDQMAIPPNVAGPATAVWGRDAISKFAENPYLLLMFEPWSDADARALRLGLSPEDPKRLAAAAEEAMSLLYRNGHMSAPLSSVRPIIRRLLAPREELWKDSVAEAEADGLIVILPDGSLQSRACRHMEHEISDQLSSRLARPSRSFHTAELGERLREFETDAGLKLDPQQVRAIEMALGQGVSIVTGGAGTGKTAVVSAIVAMREALLHGGARQATLTAVAGRAALRLKSETGRNAVTAARLVADLERNNQANRAGLLVFDEASMLDTPLAYRILTHIEAETDLLFVGDPGQLPPVGPGRLFHAMVQSRRVPSVELAKIHRQEEDSRIPSISNAARAGELLELSSFRFDNPLDKGVFIHEVGDEELTAATMRVFEAMCGPPPKEGGTAELHALDVQVLTSTKQGAAGYVNISSMIERRYMMSQKQIGDWGIHVGSRLLWLQNDYGKAPRRDFNGDIEVDTVSGRPVTEGFMNGAIGVVQRETPRGAWVRFDDGIEDEINYDDQKKFSPGWAMSVHKAQGSAFRRVIFPITRSRLMDRALVYTAMTRAKETVVFIGNRRRLRQAINQEPRVDLRGTSLTFE